MLPDRVSNPGPLTYESGALPIALCGPALSYHQMIMTVILLKGMQNLLTYTYCVAGQEFYVVILLYHIIHSFCPIVRCHKLRA